MSTTLLIISDTHVPTRARQLPSRVLEAADAADLVIHAGDWIEASTLDLLESHAAVPDTDVLIFGHSHIPWDSKARSGLRLLNPGSPTDRRRQSHCTFLTALVDDGAIRNVSLVQLGMRVNPDRASARDGSLDP
ncbi:MAG: metallophosphoesterase family protein [Salinibacterium sp.]|nr:metallophosphoesterase family protein [Salinibacterium sp.]